MRLILPCRPPLSSLFTVPRPTRSIAMTLTSSTSYPLVSELTRDRPWIRVPRPEVVEAVLDKVVRGGRHKLQWVVDFDYTLTRAHKDGHPVDCSWGVMENSHLLPDSYTDQTNALRSKYLVIEHDPSLSIEEKIPYMIEWYTKANDLLKQCKVNKSFFPRMVEVSNVEFRDGTDQMMKTLAGWDVPVLILSAGLGDLLVEVLKKFEVLTDNVKVVSNFLSFDHEGNVTGIDGEMIHVFNKSESAIHDSPYFKKLEHRHNVILMGDSVGDLQMANGVENVEALLKIGFLNNQSEEKIKKYEEIYDLVLVDDQTMTVPNWIIEKLANSD